MDYYKLLKQNRKKPLISEEELGNRDSFIKLDYDTGKVKKLIPHREPFLLVDKITGVDMTKGEELITGKRLINKNDPVFQGHFPDYPLYPGSLQLEMGGQLGLCLTYFVVNNTTKIEDDAEMVQVRATKVLGALFLEPLLPGKTAVIISKRLEYDGYFGTVMSQIISDGKVNTVSIAEVIFLNE